NSVFEVDLERKVLTTPDGEEVAFEFDEGRREKLLKGLDDIALSLQGEEAISAYESKRKLATPWLEKTG
ncbi:MAG: 3-isopropylmalate dehydratase small subunit, partial [Pseudomonadota bacterium]